MEDIQDKLGRIGAELEELRKQMNQEAEMMLKIQSNIQLTEGRMLNISKILDLKILEYMQLETEFKQNKNRSL